MVGLVEILTSSASKLTFINLSQEYESKILVHLSKPLSCIKSPSLSLEKNM